MQNCRGLLADAAAIDVGLASLSPLPSTSSAARASICVWLDSPLGPELSISS